MKNNNIGRHGGYQQAYGGSINQIIIIISISISSWHHKRKGISVINNQRK